MANRKSRGSSKKGTARPAPRQNPRPARGAAAARSSAARGTANDPYLGDSSLRAAIAERSKSPLAYLSTLPRFVVPVVMVVLLLVGLAAPLGFAIPALAVILVFIGWLAFLSWPVLTGSQRVIRLFTIGIIGLAAVARIAGWI